MKIVEFSDYKVYLKALIKTKPNAGRGQARKLAGHLNVQPMVISHVLTRDRHFTAEQALSVAEFFCLTPRETEYFMDLVYLERAGTAQLRKRYEQKLAEIQIEEENIKNHVQGREELTAVEKATFYSNWYYCAVFILAAIKDYQTIEAISAYLRLSTRKVRDVVSFLVDTGLLVQNEGLLKPGKKSIHLSDTSEFLNNHRRNWREIALAKFSEARPNDKFFSCPVSISKKDAADFRKELLEFISAFSKRVEQSLEELPMCLNIDWFQF